LTYILYTNDPPTSHFENFEWRYLSDSSSNPLLGWGFWGRRMERRYFRFDQIWDGVQPPSWKFWRNDLEWVIQATCI